MAINFPNSPTNGQEFSSGTTTWTYDGTKWVLKSTNATTNDSMPVGSIMWFAGSATPTAWLPANGAAVSRTTYATLFATIGTTYGSGDGSTTFNVPSVSATTGAYYIRFTTAVGTVTTTSLTTAPVGTMIDWPVTSSYPTGWLRADGSNVSRTSYNDLFVLIGTTYGSGDGSTTFTLPNLVAAGAGSPVKIIKVSLGGVVEPSTVAHASSHVRGGSDIIDGDRAQIDYVPANYTRNSAATGAGAVTDLTAHLSGIDNKFTTGVVASGGTITTYTDYTGATYRIHTFTNVGNTNFVVTTGGIVSALIVGGGGSGGYDNGGGGGGGGVLYHDAIAISATTYTVTVGAGGTANTNGQSANGNNSSFNGYIAYGGGGGARESNIGADGACGGGTNNFNTSFREGGRAIYGQGFDGGAWATAASPYRGGGGGGAGSPGGYGGGLSGYGGQGRGISINGNLTYYGGGGGGGADSGAAPGGIGGGGQGGVGAGVAGTANTGGGGGGGQNGANLGGNGGSGIVIIRYRIS